jgi:sterol desaturase/sphingolipid hydroxylase (fatty acid hydroxylase superfamily)
MLFIQVFVTIILGAMGWTLAEYLLHRFLGHELKGFFRKTLFHKEHTKHHHKRNYFASTRDKLLTCLGAGPVVFALSFLVTNFLLASVFTASFLAMYFVYELIHRRLHVAAPAHFFAANMRAHHFYHHFVDETMNHGVTTAFWDRIFGTYVKAHELPVPHRYKLDWMEEASTNGIYNDNFGHLYQFVENTRPRSYAS